MRFLESGVGETICNEYRYKVNPRYRKSDEASRVFHDRYEIDLRLLCLYDELDSRHAGTGTERSIDEH